MPRQKLTRKPPKRQGRQGQTQKPGPHDPEHQEGEAVEKDDAQFRHSREADNDIENGRLPAGRKEGPL